MFSNRDPRFSYFQRTDQLNAIMRLPEQSIGECKNKRTQLERFAHQEETAIIRSGVYNVSEADDEVSMLYYTAHLAAIRIQLKINDMDTPTVRMAQMDLDECPTSNKTFKNP